MTARLSFLMLLLLATPSIEAQTAESLFHQAYYLEREEKDFSAALTLYEQIAADRRSDDDLRASARARAVACREEIASSDLARLMPPDAIFYAELNRPSEQVLRLLRHLGLLRREGPGDLLQRRFAVDEKLVEGLLGLRGVAVAITEIDPRREVPKGLLILHPGELAVVRGLLETALPVASRPVEAIRGQATFQIEGGVFATLTSRLLLVSPERALIEGAIARLRGEGGASLADQAEMGELLEPRSASLLQFFIRFEPILPLIEGALEKEAGRRDAALARLLLDPQSLRSVSGRLGIGDDELSVEVSLRLDEEHRNLIFNFAQLPPLDRTTLRRIPQGAAAFLGMALNRPSGGDEPATGDPIPNPPLSALDIGREVFANIEGVALYMLPAFEGQGSGPQSIPPVAAIITARDPATSKALWSQFLSLGSLASGSSADGGTKTEMIEGVSVDVHAFRGGPSIYMASHGRSLLLSPSRAVLSRSLSTINGGPSILEDDSFKEDLGRVGEDTTAALFLHPGRCAEIARRFMSPREWGEIAPFQPAFSDTVAAVVLDHSRSELHLTALISGIPPIGPIITAMLIESRQNEARWRHLAAATGAQRWDDALAMLQEMLNSDPSNQDLLWRKLQILAAGKLNGKAARLCAEQLLQATRNSARALNNYSWSLLTEEKFRGEYNDIALNFARHSNELSRFRSWAYLDTLALAQFKTGDIQAAVAMQRKAVEHCDDKSRQESLLKALERYEKALRKPDGSGAF